LARQAHPPQVSGPGPKVRRAADRLRHGLPLGGVAPPRMSLRLKLLLLGLATLVLPWAGCRYAREMESALRQGEIDSLGSLSQTIATSLQGRSDLPYRHSAPGNSARADGATEAPATPAAAAADPDFYRATPYDLEPLS